MSFRKRRNDDDNSDCESDDERRIPVAGDEEDEDGPSASKKSRNLWSDMLLEEQLLEKGQSINLEKGQKKQSTFHRGPESYVMPADAFQKKKQEEAKLQAANGSSSSQSTTIPPPPVVVITPANDDPFGDAPIAPAENFGVKKYDREEQLAKDDGNRVGWWSSGPGHANRNNRIMAGRDRKESPRFAPKTSELLSEKYSLASFLACELDKEQMYDIDKHNILI
ncbi:unnamed protein product [Caenorhabditis angaria]|uniref:Uncharacterized protein n=1 Tax=Caenorhabditis angaria TaxID=860376 RepID=A0A9P1INJ6_9PELO|nr:unnamed protein product [Caenorhabditis angaria]